MTGVGATGAASATASSLRIAISGAGIAGPTLAFWLLRAGHRPTLIEAAPRLRTGGYMIDFWGVGFTVAERMGLLPQVRAAGYALQAVRWVDDRGRTAAELSTRTLSRELGERFTSLPRGELAAILNRAVQDHAPCLFGTTIVGLEDGGGAVGVRLSDQSEHEFDLVVGADGQHSAVRALAFGPEPTFERDLGYWAAAFEAQGYRARDDLAYVSHGVPGRQISRFAQRGDRTLFLFVFAAERLEGPAPDDLAGRKAALRRVFADVGWEWPAIAAAMDGVDELYFDRVSQIAVPAWSRRRTALVGDAAACLSLVAGEGTGVAMTEAYVLAGELALAGGDHAAAFARYEARLRPFVEAKQKSARAFAGAFAPRTAFGVWLRNQVIRLMAIPGLPGLFVGAQLRDAFDLPDYDL